MKLSMLWLAAATIPWALTILFIGLRIWVGVVLEGILGSFGLFMALKRFRQNR